MGGRGVVLLLEDLHPEAEAVLSEQGQVVHAPVPRGTPEALWPDGDLGNVRAILTRGRGLVDGALIDACPALEVIARPGAGTDNLAVAHAASRGIPTIHAPGVNAGTVAEHTMALILGSVRGLVRSAVQVAAGRWDDRGSYDGREIAGLTLGIVGYGTVGRKVATLARAFGMEVVVAASASRPVAPEAGVLALADVLARSDVLTLHVPLDDRTRGLIGAAELAALPAGAHVVNTARGDVIDGAALRAALASGHLGGFAADVLDDEPPAADDALLRSDRVVLTPHVAALTGATYRRMCLVAATNVAAVLSGDAPDPGSVATPR